MKSFTLWKAGMLCFASLFFILVGCNQSSQEEFSELQRLTVERNDCFFDNQCLLEENKGISQSVNAIAPANDAFISPLKHYFGDRAQQGLVDYIQRNHGTPFWQGSKILKVEEDGSQIGLIPILKTNSEYVETIMLVNLDKSRENPKFNFVERAKIDKYQKESDTDISYGVALLSFLNLDKRVFGKTNTDFAGRYRALETSLKSSDSQGAVSRNVICYAVLTKVTTSWYQYNSNTGTLTQLSDTYSYYWQDLCLDMGIDLPPSPNATPTGSPNPPNGSNDFTMCGSQPCALDAESDLCAQKTFPFKKTGNGYTIQLNEFKATFLEAKIAHDYPFQFSTTWYTAKIPVLCLQVRDEDRYGNALTAEKAADLAALAYIEARDEIKADAQIGLIRDDSKFSGINTDVTTAFKTDFKEKLFEQFGAGVTIAYGSTCSGNIPQSRPYFKYYGLCLPVSYN